MPTRRGYKRPTTKKVVKKTVYKSPTGKNSPNPVIRAASNPKPKTKVKRTRKGRGFLGY